MMHFAVTLLTATSPFPSVAPIDLLPQQVIQMKQMHAVKMLKLASNQ